MQVPEVEERSSTDLSGGDRKRKVRGSSESVIRTEGSAPTEGPDR